MIDRGLYRHFKGAVYRVITVAEHTETGENFVIYYPVKHPSKVYARPLEMFMSDVDKKKYPNTKQQKRFERIVYDMS